MAARINSLNNFSVSFGGVVISPNGDSVTSSGGSTGITISATQTPSVTASAVFVPLPPQVDEFSVSVSVPEIATATEALLMHTDPRFTDKTTFSVAPSGYLGTIISMRLDLQNRLLVTIKNSTTGILSAHALSISCYTPRA